MEIGKAELTNGRDVVHDGEKIPNVTKKLFAMKNLCTECRACEMTCSLVHAQDNLVNPQSARLQIASPGEHGEHTFAPAVHLCRHCANPPSCAVACPVDAFYYDTVTHAAIIDQERCIQCLECIPACPFGTIYVAPDGQVLKCDLCGGDPACVKACAARPEAINAGRQYPKSPVLFYEVSSRYSAISRRKPQPTGDAASSREHRTGRQK